MSVYEVPRILVPDGTYSYRKVQLRGPALPVTVTVHDGCLFALVTGEAPDAQAAHQDALLTPGHPGVAPGAWRT